MLLKLCVLLTWPSVLCKLIELSVRYNNQLNSEFDRFSIDLYSIKTRLSSQMAGESPFYVPQIVVWHIHFRPFPSNVIVILIVIGVSCCAHNF